MAELDLTNPAHLAEILRAGLPGFAAESAERVAPLVDALACSNSDVFATVGVGKRKGDPAEPELSDQARQAPPGEQLPLDMGGEGLQLDDAQFQGPGRELGRVPIIARRGWTESDRVHAKGRHEVYALAAKHERSKPIRAVFTGSCQAVRVRLPAHEPADDAFIGTWLGTVEAKDHLLFSVEEVAQRYADHFDRREPIVRVDLITGARFRGRRFSPVSIYLAYRDESERAKPIFYFLEGGSAAGKPKALYYSPTIGGEIKAQSGFSFTPFACRRNWYEGGMAMNPQLSEPACVYLKSAQTRDGRHQYLELTVNYQRYRDLEHEQVTHPFELQVEAAMRVMAIADEAQCQLKVGAGGVLQHSLGPTSRALIHWDERPNGSTTPQERKQFCGCPKP